MLPGRTISMSAGVSEGSVTMKLARRGAGLLAGLMVGLLATVGGAAVFETASVGATTSPGPWQVADPEAVLGGIDFFDASGNLITTGSTSSPLAGFAVAQDAPAGGLKATLFAYTPVSGQAAGNWTGSQLTTAKAYPIATPADLSGLANPIVTGTTKDISLASFIATTPNTDTSATDGYAGVYELRMQVSSIDGYATAFVHVNGTTWSQVAGSYTSPAAGGSGPVTTMTTVTASPASPVTAGTPVTFTATVSPTAPGSVQFKNDGVNLGSAVTVSGSTATSAAATLTTASHSITAVFTPADPTAFVASTSAAITYVVNPAGGSGAITTTTALAVTPASSTFGTSVTLTATVTPASGSASAVGSVQFLVGATNFGS